MNRRDFFLLTAAGSVAGHASYDYGKPLLVNEDAQEIYTRFASLATSHKFRMTVERHPEGHTIATLTHPNTKGMSRTEYRWYKKALDAFLATSCVRG